MISLMNMSPWELVAVTTRAPVAEAPIAALRAECSDSTVMNSASTRPSCDDVRQMLGHMGLRRDGIDGRHIELAERGRFRRRNRHFHSYALAHPYSSSLTILMAPGQHSWAQIPQPLQ